MNASTLFPNPEDDQHNKLIWKSSESNNSKAQKDFNAALAKHKAAVKQAQIIDELVQFAHAEYAKLILPELENKKNLTALRTEMMVVIYLEDIVKLGRNQKQLLKACILEICSSEIENDRAFYYNIILQLETTSERNLRLAEKQRVEQQIKNQYGVDVDLDDLSNKNFKTEEERQAHQEKYKEFFEKYKEQEDKEFQDYYSGKNRKEKTKTKSEKEKEAKLAEVEKLLNTDINKLFKELAKLIHPDREQNPALRIKKENLMKELSNARDNSDIADILRIKMLVDELLPNNTKELSLNDSSIKRFVSIIKSKIADLEKTIKQKAYSFPFELTVNPKFLSPKIIQNHIKSQLKTLTLNNKDVETEIDALREDPKFIRDLIEDYQFMGSLYWR